MPMIDLKSSPGALPAERLTELADRLTAVLLEHREVPDTERSRRNVWLFAAETTTLVVGRPPRVPHVVATFTIVAGGMTDDHKAGLVEDATRLLRAAVGDAHVWVLVKEITDGNWGADGAITRLSDAQAILGAAPSSGGLSA